MTAVRAFPTQDVPRTTQIEQLRTLCDAEVQLIDALPELAEHAAHTETRRHKMRLEQVFQNLEATGA